MERNSQEPKTGRKFTVETKYKELDLDELLLQWRTTDFFEIDNCEPFWWELSPRAWVSRTAKNLVSSLKGLVYKRR